jgi:hypothetical protein
MVSTPVLIGLGVGAVLWVVAVIVGFRDEKKKHTNVEDTKADLVKEPKRKPSEDTHFHEGAYPPEDHFKPLDIDWKKFQEKYASYEQWGAILLIAVLTTVLYITGAGWKEDAVDCSLKTGYNLKSIPGQAIFNPPQTQGAGE